MNPQLTDWDLVRQASDALRSVAETSVDEMGRFRDAIVAGSQASMELNGFSNEGILTEAYAKGGRSLVIACDYAFALVRSITEPVLSYSPWGCTREILESSSMCLWVLDTGIGSSERATRSLDVRRAEIKSAMTYLRKDLKRNPDQDKIINKMIQDADKRLSHLRKEARAVGVRERFDRKTGQRFLGFGDKDVSITERIEATVKDPIDYSLLSPATHGDSWATLVLGTRIESVSPPDAISDLPAHYALLMLIKSLEWIAESSWTQHKLLGWSLTGLESVLESEYSRARLKPDTRFWRSNR